MDTKTYMEIGLVVGLIVFAVGAWLFKDEEDKLPGVFGFAFFSVLVWQVPLILFIIYIIMYGGRKSA